MLILGKTIHVALGSMNEAKVAAVLNVLSNLLGLKLDSQSKVLSYSGSESSNFIEVSFQEKCSLKLNTFFVESGVSEQPIHRQDTEMGARMRIQALKKKAGKKSLDFYIGIEGGLEKDSRKRWTARECVVVEDKKGNLSSSYTSAFFISSALVEEVMMGKTLSEAIALQYKKKSEEVGRLGACWFLTGGAICRKDLLSQALILAWAPLLLG